jgi:hypothetical protein
MKGILAVISLIENVPIMICCTTFILFKQLVQFWQLCNNWGKVLFDGVAFEVGTLAYFPMNDGKRKLYHWYNLLKIIISNVLWISFLILFWLNQGSFVIASIETNDLTNDRDSIINSQVLVISSLILFQKCIFNIHTHINQ